MLASIWILPSVIGIYALLVGFSFVYVITTVLNLLLLRKKCPEKPKIVRYLFSSAAITLPTVLLGVMAERLLTNFLGIFFTFLACTLITCVFYGLMAFGFNLISFEIVKGKAKKFIFKKPQKA